jgi:hypothetical protein
MSSATIGLLRRNDRIGKTLSDFVLFDQSREELDHVIFSAAPL